MFKGRTINSHSVSLESGKGFLIVKTNTLKLLGSAVLSESPPFWPPNSILMEVSFY